MFNVAMRILNDRAEAEDVLQESFIKAFEKLASFRGDASFGSWIKRIVINGAINQSRKKQLQFEEIDDRIHGATEGEEDNTQNGMEYTVADVKRGVSLLPDGFRMVFSLYMFENMSHKEIAEQLEISESTSKSQLNRAKKKLKLLILEA